MEHRMLRVSDIAKRLGINAVTVRRWIEAGQGPKGIRTPGNVWLFSQESVELWLRSLEASPEKRVNNG